MMGSMTVNLKGLKDRPREIIRTAAENWRLLLLAMLFVCGLVSGSILCGKESDIPQLVSELAAKAFLLPVSKNFMHFFCLNLICTIVALLSGLSAIGLPLILLTPCLKGVIVGAISSFFYTTYRLDGVIFSLIIIFPAAAITALMTIIGCNEAAILSGIIAKAAFSTGNGGRGELKAYFLRFGIILLVTCFCSLVQAACVSGFGDQLLV